MYIYTTYNIYIWKSSFHHKIKFSSILVFIQKKKKKRKRRRNREKLLASSDIFNSISDKNFIMWYLYSSLHTYMFVKIKYILLSYIYEKAIRETSATAANQESTFIYLPDYPLNIYASLYKRVHFLYITFQRLYMATKTYLSIYNI